MHLRKTSTASSRDTTVSLVGLHCSSPVRHLIKCHIQEIHLLFVIGAFTIMGDLFDATTGTWAINGRHLVRQQDFWYVMGMTTWIVLPWICTREVPVDIELVSRQPTEMLQMNLINVQPSPKVAIVRFRRGMQQGLLGRISRSAVKEYHAFGIIS